MTATFDPDLPVISASGLTVCYRRAGARRSARTVAVHGVDLSIRRGTTLGLVGESGSGKSSLARAILRLVEPSAGQIFVNGRDITRISWRQLRPLRRHMQMVFQDPYSSLDPSASVENSIAEPLIVHEGLTGRILHTRVGEALDSVHLDRSYAQRYPQELSGGQRQRVAIARAISIRPQLLVLDEAVSALDVSTQAQILTLLERLRRELDLSYLFISHNLAVVSWLADRIAVMYGGRIVEQGPPEQVCLAPAHPYTQSLLAAMPVPDPAIQRRRRTTLDAATAAVTTSDEMSEQRSKHRDTGADPPQGCTFDARCPYASEHCRSAMPQPAPVPGAGWVACHHHAEIAAVPHAVSLGGKP